MGPGWVESAGQLCTLRFRLFARRLTGRGFLGTLVAVSAAMGLSGALGVGSFLLFSAVPAIYTQPIWMAFVLSLFCFLVGLFWVLWPVIAAQVDEAYELGRFFVYPVRPGRLYLIQSAVGLVEPAVLFFYPALVGAGLGLDRSLQPGLAATLLLMLAFALMNVAAGRFLQNFFLNLMTSRRSGEYLFAGLLLLLGLSAFLPPVEASWIFERLGGFGASPEDLQKLLRTARALGNTPPGWLAVGLSAAAAGHAGEAVSAAVSMLAMGAVTWLLGLVLLKRFYRGGRGWRFLPSAKKAGANRRPARLGWRLPFGSDSTSAVFEKELKTLVSNPKARLLFAVPFFLVILVKIFGAPQLFLYLWGEAWAAVLLSALGAYLLSVLSGQFFGNGFGYDGHGVKQTYLTPVPPGTWLVGRNLAQGVFAAVQFTGLMILVLVLLPGARSRALVLPLLSFPFGLLVMLAVGNLLSARYPRRFHLSLARRDRPVGASFVWVLLVLGTCVLVTLAALALSGGTESGLWLSLLALPLLGLVIYRVLLPVSQRWTATQRERIIEAVSR